MRLTKNQLKKIFFPQKPLARLLKTGSGYYLYDTGTNKILGCSETVYTLTNRLLEKEWTEAVDGFISDYGENEFVDAAKEIISAVESENILSAFSASPNGMSGHLSRDISSFLENSVRVINLELTEECNLRCVYCIYQDHFTEKRNYGGKVMNFDTARAAIDMLKKHSSLQKEISIGFYGGEPLIRFPFIKECVKYARNIFNRQKITFNITTEGDACACGCNSAALGLNSWADDSDACGCNCSNQNAAVDAESPAMNYL